MAALAAALDSNAADPVLAVTEMLATGPEGSPNDRRLLLLVDQFEEVFTVARTDVVAFQQALLRLAITPHCYIVLTVCADFYAELMATPLWLKIQAHRYEVLPLNADNLREAIVKPAANLGVFVETALAERLMGDAAGEPGILPLIQERLVLLWERLQRRLFPLNAFDYADAKAESTDHGAITEANRDRIHRFLSADTGDDACALR